MTDTIQFRDAPDPTVSQWEFLNGWPKAYEAPDGGQAVGMAWPVKVSGPTLKSDSDDVGVEEDMVRPDTVADTLDLLL